MASRPGFVRRVLGDVLGGLWRLLDVTRRLVANLLFLAVLLVLAAVWWSASRPAALDEKTALVLNLAGRLVEQYTGSTSEAMLAQALGERRRETRLRDVVAAIDAAAGDPRISSAVLVLDDLSGGGSAALREIAAALARFRESGKPIVAWGSSFSQRQYFLAAHADEVYLHPRGHVFLRGLGGSGLYFRDALDRLGITVHAFQAGKYKTAVEPLTRNAPSTEALEADQAWLNDMWGAWTAEVERARKLPSGAIGRIIDELPQKMAATQGDPAQLALNEKLVDALKTRDEFRAAVIERGAAASGEHGTFRQVPFDQYLAHVPARHGDAIGVVVAQGEIIDGDAPQGVVSARVTSELIRRAREDQRIKALVLRIDSPGGTMFGGELIRREVELTRGAGKPVIASMGDVAASAGYSIAAEADVVFADPTSITGSIGVFGVLPTFEGSVAKLGVGTGGASTTWLAAATNPLLPLDRRLAEMLQLGVVNSYRQFVAQVAGRRKTTPERIDSIAQGRVWTGRQAKSHGLVDELGGLQRALQAAAQRAGLPSDAPVIYIEREPRGVDRWLALFFGELASRIDLGSWLLSIAPAALAHKAADEFAVFRNAAGDPLRTYGYCFCRVSD